MVSLFFKSVVKGVGFTLGTCIGREIHERITKVPSQPLPEPKPTDTSSQSQNKLKL